MKKYLAIATLALTLGVAAKPAEAATTVAYTSGVPWGVKAAAIGVGVITMSVMLNALIVSGQQKRQLSLEEGQYAAFLPFLWVVRPLPVAAPAKKKR